jgi:DNA polymerase-3 subunit alpha
LTEKLGYEKDVTGMFMSGHPLDHFKFEMKYYSIMQLSDFNEVKESNTLMQSNVGRPYRIAGLVIDAQHRTTKTGRNFGILTIEDFSGKTEIALWSDDYMKFQHYLDKGKNILVNGFFKSSWKADSFEFKVGSITLLETAKQNLTKSIEINLHPAAISDEFVEFISTNVKNNPGKSSLKFNVIEPRDNIKISMYTTDKGFTMNEDMAEFLLNNLDIEINVALTA